MHYIVSKSKKKNYKSIIVKGHDILISNVILTGFIYQIVILDVLVGSTFLAGIYNSLMHPT